MVTVWRDFRGVFDGSFGVIFASVFGVILAGIGPVFWSPVFDKILAGIGRVGLTEIGRVRV